MSAAGPPVRWFVLNAETNTEMDFTAVSTLEELRAELADRGIIMGWARVRFEVRADLERAGFIDAIGAEHMYETLPTTVEAFQDWATEHPAAGPNDSAG